MARTQQKPAASKPRKKIKRMPWMDKVREEIDARIRQSAATSTCSVAQSEIATQLEIPEKLNQVNSALERLGAALADLQDRLAPVLVSEGPASHPSTDGSKEQPASTTLGAHLAGRAESVTAMARMVERMVQRLAL